MAASIAIVGLTLYGIGLRADRIHAGRAVTEPGIGGSGETEATAAASVKWQVPALGSGSDSSPGSVTPRLYRGHSAGYWNWQYRVAKRQSRNAVRYARRLERLIRAHRHPAPTRTLSGYSVWDSLAGCEAGGDWGANTGNGFFGGLQFTLGTWTSHGGSGMPNQASREQQIAVAERVLADQGWGAWPACSAKLGLR